MGLGSIRHYCIYDNISVTKSCSIYLCMILIIKSSNVYASMYMWHGRQSEEAFCVQYIWIVY